VLLYHGFSTCFSTCFSAPRILRITASTEIYFTPEQGNRDLQPDRNARRVLIGLERPRVKRCGTVKDTLCSLVFTRAKSRTSSSAAVNKHHSYDEVEKPALLTSFALVLSTPSTEACLQTPAFSVLISKLEKDNTCESLRI